MEVVLICVCLMKIKLELALVQTISKCKLTAKHAQPTVQLVNTVVALQTIVAFQSTGPVMEKKIALTEAMNLTALRSIVDPECSNARVVKHKQVWTA